ncbi:carboxypeptidase s [Phaeosphaeria sp. MPI-PUGE-AT-0046c]|nr:carboxypeptidase s [Phaeosphaeria sp. MPI-PUGE-AT-0046c]
MKSAKKLDDAQTYIDSDAFLIQTSAVNHYLNSGQFTSTQLSPSPSTPLKMTKEGINPRPAPAPGLPRWRLLLGIVLFVWGFSMLRRSVVMVYHLPESDLDTSPQTKPQPRCPQVEPLVPSKSSVELDDMQTYLVSDAFRSVAIERLSGAVQIPTQSFDDMADVGDDPRWEIFFKFAKYLEETFPLIHATLELEKVNTHGLLYTWAGKDKSLKPNLLMAHQDVVPVPDSTAKSWTHPPFSGYFDGKFVWGRGASDCKNQLIGILSAVEALLSANFTPRRTLILSFGFDEEVSGGRGAAQLAEHLVSKLGHNSVAAIVDEGAVNLENWGADFALPGVAEKGYIDVDIVIRMPGGHSSIPPQHNGIGVASELITLIEGSTYEPHLYDENPYLELLNCGAEYAPHFPKKLSKLLNKRSSTFPTCSKKHKKDALAREAAKAGPAVKYLFTTSVAVDIINGGVKTNALPERTIITVNHRINVGSNSAAVETHITSLAAQVAHNHNLTLHAFNGTESPSSITLSHRSTVLEPAPITPTSLHPSSNSSLSTPFSVLSGTTRALYGKELLVSPGIMTGNTDTKYYWDLSEHIFRYGPGWDKEQTGLGNIHTVDEKMGVQAHIDTTRWMWAWIRNMDEAEL